MTNVFKKIKYWYWRKYKEYPHAGEMLSLYARGMPRSKDDRLKYRWAEVTFDYICTANIRETAERYGVTRERVRQIIRMAYRKWK